MAPLARASLFGAGVVLISQCVIQWLSHPSSSWPQEDRYWNYIFYGPPLVIVGCVIGWIVAYKLRLPYDFYIGAGLPFLLLMAALATGALLSALQVDPVHGWDAWLGWTLVALLFYPFATVWYLSPARRLKLIVTAVTLSMFAAMVGYSWLARERWRGDYYQHVVGRDVTLLEVPGFHPAWLNERSEERWEVSYGLAGDAGGPYRGRTIEVRSAVSPSEQSPRRAEETTVTLSGKNFQVNTDYDLLPLVRRTASTKIWSLHDLRYIPVGPPWHSLSMGG